MSVLFYHRPDYLNKASGPINALDCARYVERAKDPKRTIPQGLSFDDVINRKSLPPCSLNDFMDYLVYVEYNAENLQFFLWYGDYVRRFDALPEKEKALSPEWMPEAKDLPNLSNDREKGEKKRTKRDTLETAIDTGYDSKTAAFFDNESEFRTTPTSPGHHISVMKGNGSTIASSVSESTTPSTVELTSQAGLKWQTFTIQPMREEINRVMRHYLAFNAPRELNLSHRDRALCLHALQHTTHPSALLLAVNIAEAALRGQSHPNFIRWSICNGNKPRVFFVRTMGVSNIAFGFIIAIFLTLSRASRWWRIFAAIEWFIGISTMVAAYKGLCVILHKGHYRNLRPWEQDVDSEIGDSRRHSDASTGNRTVHMSSRIGNHGDLDKSDAGSFRPSNLETFGPKNSFDHASWIEKYQQKPLLRKVFDQTTWTQDEALRVLQDKIVLGANLWALIITIPLTVIFVAIPKGNFY